MADDGQRRLITKIKQRFTPRNILRALYSNLKSMDEYLKFVMLTGVTRYSKTSVFSGLNNLEDISLDDSYATICGITEAEMKEYLQSGIEELALKETLSYDELMEKLKFYYDEFSMGAPGQAKQSDIRDSIFLIFKYLSSYVKNNGCIVNHY